MLKLGIKQKAPWRLKSVDALAYNYNIAKEALPVLFAGDFNATIVNYLYMKNDS